MIREWEFIFHFLCTLEEGKFNQCSIFWCIYVNKPIVAYKSMRLYAGEEMTAKFNI